MQRHRNVRAYCRVSGDAQAEHGTSLEGQDQEIKRWCEQHGQPKPILYVEVESAGESTREKRVELKRLIDEAEPGDLVLTVLVDRWARDVAYTLDVVRKFKRDGVRWIAVEDGIDSDDERGFSDLIRRASEAEIEREKIRRRTVGTRQRLRKLGFFVEGLPPLGYKIVKRKLVIEPESAEIVRKMFDLCIAGRSLREVSAALTAEYPSVHGLDPTAVMRRLKDRRYLGEMNTVGTRGRKAPRGEWIRAHEAIVDQVTFDRAQAALRDRRMSGRPTTAEARTAKFLCRSLILCSKCGHHLHSWAPESGASTKHGGYYQCINKCVRARHDKVDALVEEDTLSHLESLAHRLARPEKAKPKVDRSGERDKLIKKRERLVAAIADGIVSNDDARSQMAEISSKLLALSAPEPVRKIDPSVRLREVEEIRRSWAHLTTPEKNRIVARLAAKIEITSTAVKRWQRGAWSLHIEWKE